MIRVITADDHQLIRFGLRRAIEKTPDIEVAEEAHDGRILIEKLRHAAFDVLVLDISMPGMDIFDLLGDIKNLAPKMPILILTVHSEKQYALRLMKAGVSGYLQKDCTFREILTAIRQVHAGKKYITEDVAEVLSEHIGTRSDRAPHERLTNREYQVMSRIAAGKSVSEIADELYISVKTVSTHRSHILQKMALENNAQIMQYAMANGLT
ncbi:MAG: response regulator [Thermodesulfobacteriota bacterium]